MTQRSRPISTPSTRATLRPARVPPPAIPTVAVVTVRSSSGRVRWNQPWRRGADPLDRLLDSLLLIAICGLCTVLAVRLSGSTPTQGSSSLNPAPVNAPKPNPVLALRQAIVMQESLGNHAAIVNWSGSGALGLGQVMPENLSDWSDQCLGRSLTPDEFLNDAALQLQVIDCKLTEFWQDEKDDHEHQEDLRVRRVASRWYSGQSDFYDSTDPQVWNGHQYPSVQEYTLKVLKNYQSLQ